MLKKIQRVSIDVNVKWNDATAIYGRFGWTIKLLIGLLETDKYNSSLYSVYLCRWNDFLSISETFVFILSSSV